MVTARRQGPARVDQHDIRRHAWRALFECSRLVIDRLDTEMREQAGYGMQTYDALLRIYEGGADGVRMTDLAEHIMFSKAGLTSLIDRLEGMGLVRRTPHPEDRRAILLTLTDRGIDEYKATARMHVTGIRHHFTDHLSDAEAEVMVRVLERVRANLDNGQA